MAKIKLLENETVIAESNNGRCILTNFRVRYSDVQLGKSYFSSILLKNISSIEIGYRSNIVFVILGVIGGGVSFLLEEYLLIGVMISIFLFLVYFLTRRHLIVISSNGGVKMKLLVKGMSTTEILKFHNQIEQAIINNKQLWD